MCEQYNSWVAEEAQIREKMISLKKTEQAHISNHANSDDLKPNFFLYFINPKKANTKINVDIEAGKESPCSPINAPVCVCVVLAVGNPRTLRFHVSVDADYALPCLQRECV